MRTSLHHTVVYRGLAYVSALVKAVQQKQNLNTGFIYICVKTIICIYIVQYSLELYFAGIVIVVNRVILPLGSQSIIIYGSSSHIFMCQSFLLLSGEPHCVQDMVC